MKLEKLLREYNELQDIDSNNYNDLSGFSIWLCQRGFKLNGISPIYFVTENQTVETVNDVGLFIETNNIILTNPSDEIKFDIIQLMQDKGLTFGEMEWLCINLQNDIKELKNKQDENA